MLSIWSPSKLLEQTGTRDSLPFPAKQRADTFLHVSLAPSGCKEPFPTDEGALARQNSSHALITLVCPFTLGLFFVPFLSDSSMFPAPVGLPWDFQVTEVRLLEPCWSLTVLSSFSSHQGPLPSGWQFCLPEKLLTPLSNFFP